MTFLSVMPKESLIQGMLNELTQTQATFNDKLSSTLPGAAFNAACSEIVTPQLTFSIGGRSVSPITVRDQLEQSRAALQLLINKNPNAGSNTDSSSRMLIVRARAGINQANQIVENFQKISQTPTQNSKKTDVIRYANSSLKVLFQRVSDAIFNLRNSIRLVKQDTWSATFSDNNDDSSETRLITYSKFAFLGKLETSIEKLQSSEENLLELEGNSQKDPIALQKAVKETTDQLIRVNVLIRLSGNHVDSSACPTLKQHTENIAVSVKKFNADLGQKIIQFYAEINKSLSVESEIFSKIPAMQQTYFSLCHEVKNFIKASKRLDIYNHHDAQTHLAKATQFQDELDKLNTWLLQVNQVKVNRYESHFHAQIKQIEDTFSQSFSFVGPCDSEKEVPDFIRISVEDQLTSFENMMENFKATASELFLIKPESEIVYKDKMQTFELQLTKLKNESDFRQGLNNAIWSQASLQDKLEAIDPHLDVSAYESFSAQIDQLDSEINRYEELLLGGSRVDEFDIDKELSKAVVNTVTHYDLSQNLIEMDLGLTKDEVFSFYYGSPPTTPTIDKKDY
jgi:hypothetical protein